jgi:hypothetical protein
MEVAGSGIEKIDRGVGSGGFYWTAYACSFDLCRPHNLCKLVHYIELGQFGWNDFMHRMHNWRERVC